MSIHRASVGNIMDAQVTVIGDQNTWTNDQIVAWDKVCQAFNALKHAHTPKVLSPEQIVAQALAKHGLRGEQITTDIMDALADAKLQIVGTGAKVDKPKPPSTQTVSVPARLATWPRTYLDALDREQDEANRAREERDRS